jgi:hypothetical protein
MATLNLFGAILLMKQMTMITTMTKSCSPVMTVVTIPFENPILVAHSVVLNSSMTMMRMSLRSPHLVVAVRQVVDLQDLPIVAPVAGRAAHLAAPPGLQVVVLQAEVPVVGLQVEVPAVALQVEALVVVLQVEVLVADPQVEVLVVVLQAEDPKVDLLSERALLGD